MTRTEHVFDLQIIMCHKMGIPLFFLSERGLVIMPNHLPICVLLQSEQLDDLDLDTLYELQNVHVEALTKLCQAKV